MKLTFKRPTDADYFLDKVRGIMYEREGLSKQEKASKMLATHIIVGFLDKQRKLGDGYFEKPKSITLSEQVQLAIFILSEQDPHNFFTNMRGETDQKLLA